MRTRLAVSRCCCEEPSCLLAQDDFERANTSDLDAGSPCGWTEQSGSTLQIVSGEVIGTGTAICGYTKSTRPWRLRIVGTFRFYVTRGAAQFIYQWTDEDNHCFIEAKHTSTKLQMRIVTVRNGAQTVRLTSEVDHTRNTNELFDLCVMWSTAGGTDGEWKAEAIISSQLDGQFALTATAEFEFDPGIDETGVSGFYLSGCYLQSWQLWKSSLDDSNCDNCYGCNRGEVFDGFDVDSDVLLTSYAGEWTGQWAQDQNTWTIENGVLASTGYGYALWCWHKDSTINDDLDVLAQITLHDFVDSGWFGEQPERLQFLLSSYWRNLTKEIGFVALYDAEYVCYWYAIDFDNTVKLSAVPTAGDVLKVTALRIGLNEYELKWYLNGSLVRSITSNPGTQNWDSIKADNICLGGVWAQEWDDFYFLSNAVSEA